MRRLFLRCSAVMAAGLSLACAALAGLLLSEPAAGAATTRTVQVVVVPQYAGVHFTLDGIPAVTGPGGSVVADDPDLTGAAAHLVLAQQQLSPDLRVQLDRVAADPNHGAFSRKLVAELDAYRAVTFHLVGPKGTALPLGQVESVTLQNSLGARIRIPAAGLRAPVWLPSSVPASVTAGIENRVVAYSVQSVMVHGTNVVNTGQLRFTASRSVDWTVPVILRSLTVVGNNLLTGGPAGRAVQLTYPDGHRRTVQLGSDHRVTITELPRGTYGVKILGGGIPLASTVRLSRNQIDDEALITYGDMLEVLAIVAAVTGAVVAAGVLGRRRRNVLTQHRGETDVALT